MAFDVTMEGFSGPLDLLCSLVESRAIAASRVRVSDVVRLYGAYLARGDVMTIREMAEEIGMLKQTITQLKQDKSGRVSDASDSTVANAI